MVELMDELKDKVKEVEICIKNGSLKKRLRSKDKWDGWDEKGSSSIER